MKRFGWLTLWLCGWMVSSEAAYQKVPGKPFDLGQLTTELKQAVPALEGCDDTWGALTCRRATGDFTAAEKAAMETVFSMHVPRPLPPNPNEELTAAITQATTLQELKDALLGKTRQGRVKAERP